MNAQQAASHKEINMLYYFVSMIDIPPEQDPLPMPLEVFYVATNVVQDGREYNGAKVSPAFRTLGEARAFLDTCGIDGAYCLGTKLSLRNDAEREEYETEIFVNGGFGVYGSSSKRLVGGEEQAAVTDGGAA